MFRRIMVPLDGSAFGDYALPTAVELARRTGATLELVHVHRPETGAKGHASAFGIHHLLGRDRNRYGSGWGVEVERMHELADQLRRDESLAVYAQVVQGDAVAPELVRRARNTFADFVVMTSHGRGGARPAGIGDVAGHLVRHLEMPVLVIRPAADTPAPPADARFHHVLVPLDGSARSEDVLSASRRLAHPFRSNATLLRVIESNARPRTGVDPLTDQAARRDEAHAYLSRVADRIAPDWLRPSVAIATHESVAGGILGTARDVGADLIAMATHGRTGVARLVLGSVAEQVLRSSELPLLLFGPAAAAGPAVENSIAAVTARP